MKCKCGDPNCKNELHFDSNDNTVIINVCNSNTAILLYLDPNELVKLIQEARRQLDELTKK